MPTHVREVYTPKIDISGTGTPEIDAPGLLPREGRPRGTAPNRCPDTQTGPGAP